MKKIIKKQGAINVYSKLTAIRHFFFHKILCIVLRVFWVIFFIQFCICKFSSNIFAISSLLLRLYLPVQILCWALQLQDLILICLIKQLIIQTNSQLFHSSADRQKVLEEVSKIIAEKLQPRPKPKSKNTSGANALAETIKYKKNGEPAKKRGPKPK